MTGVEWTERWYLVLAVLAVPVWLMSRHAAGRVRWSSLRVLPARTSTWRTRLAWIPDVLLALAVIALVIAMAGPRKGIRDAEVRTEGIAIMMVLDVSSSMQALDLSERDQERNRLDVIKTVFEHFVLGGGGLKGRRNDAIGLVSFARYADTRSPLTLDHGNLVVAARLLELADPRSGEDGTAIGDGLALAVERLAASPARSKVAIVLTDGEDNASAVLPAEAAVFAAEQGVKVYTIGAGSNGVAPVRVNDPMTGRSELIQVPVSIDDDLLRSIAKPTGGAYFRATDAAGLRQVYKEIDRLERTELQENRFLDYNEYYPWFIAIGLGLAVLALLIRASLLRRLP